MFTEGQTQSKQTLSVSPVLIVNHTTTTTTQTARPPQPRRSVLLWALPKRVFFGLARALSHRVLTSFSQFYCLILPRPGYASNTLMLTPVCPAGCETDFLIVLSECP